MKVSQDFLAQKVDTVEGKTLKQFKLSNFTTDGREVLLETQWNKHAILDYKARIKIDGEVVCIIDRDELTSYLAIE